MLQKEQIVYSHVHIGLKTPIRILHVTDAHIVIADDRDNDRKQALASKRHQSFVERMGEQYEQNYLDMLEWGKSHCNVTVDTGDIIDFTSVAAFEEMHKIVFEIGGPNLVCAVGNHEFSQYVGEAKEDFAYKMQSYSQVQNSIVGNIDFAARIIDGVNFVTLDNSYYDFTEKQLQLLQVETQKPYPIVLCMHTPIYHEEYLRHVQNGDASIPGYVVGAPVSVTSQYGQKRGEQQFSSQTTQKVVDYILKSTSIKLILAGHTHENYDCKFDSGLQQLVTDMAGRAARIITID